MYIEGKMDETTREHIYSAVMIFKFLDTQVCMLKTGECTI